MTLADESDYGMAVVYCAPGQDVDVARNGLQVDRAWRFGYLRDFGPGSPNAVGGTCAFETIVA
jgi:hypothetical protein